MQCTANLNALRCCFENRLTFIFSSRQFSSTLFVVIILELGFGIFAAISKDKVEKEVIKDFSHVIHNYYSIDKAEKDVINGLQKWVDIIKIPWTCAAYNFVDAFCFFRCIAAVSKVQPIFHKLCISIYLNHAVIIRKIIAHTIVRLESRSKVASRQLKIS